MGTTPTYALPYPEPTDLVKDGAQAIEDLALAVDSAITAAKQANTGRNLVINGAMQVAQRGTSTTGITTSGYRTADRWTTVGNTAGTWTETIEADAPTGSGLRNSRKLLCTTANNSLSAGSEWQVQQRFVGQDLQIVKKGTASAEQLTLSFWVKSNVTGTYVATLSDFDNTRQVGAQYTVSASATWEKKTITFPADTTGAFDNDENRSLTLIFWLVAGSDRTSGTLRTTWASSVNADLAVGQVNVAAATNNYWQITGVQLEVGPVATGFDFEPYETTLRKCQRYYQRLDPGVANYQLFGGGWASSTTNFEVFVNFIERMRVAPTALETTGTASNYCAVKSDGLIVACNSVPAFNSGSNWGMTITGTVASGLTAGISTALRQNNVANAYLGWSAEL